MGKIIINVSVNVISPYFRAIVGNIIDSILLYYRLSFENITGNKTRYRYRRNWYEYRLKMLYFVSVYIKNITQVLDIHSEDIMSVGSLKIIKKKIK